MSLHIFLVLFVVLMAISSAQSVDYCASQWCTANTHVGCNNNGAFGATCPANVRLINITNFRSLIITEHNRYRNIVAGGGLTQLKPATRMASMLWAPELSNLASLNVKQCKMEHDKCRSTAKFHFAGQNLALQSFTQGAPYNMNALVKNSIKMWYDEQKYTTMTIINKFTANTNPNKEYGHFTGMMGDRNYAVGCGGSLYTQNGWTTFLFACDYALTNMIGTPVYKAGVTASGCKTGKNPNYKNLCSVKEVYNPNVF